MKKFFILFERPYEGYDFYIYNEENCLEAFNKLSELLNQGLAACLFDFDTEDVVDPHRYFEDYFKEF